MPEDEGKMRAVLGCEIVRLCQRGAALKKANAVQDCIRQGIFSADGKTLPSCKALLKSHLGGLCPALVLGQGDAESEEGGREGLLLVCLDKRSLCCLRGDEKMERC